MPQSVTELHALIDETPAMLWRGDRDGRCVFLNRSQREFWGVDDSGLEAFDWSTTLLAEDLDKVFVPFQEGMSSQKPFTCEARYRRADGVIRILRTKAAPYFGADGAFRGMTGVNEDVTDLREAQASLDERNRDLAGSLHQASVATRRFELASQISGLAMSEHDEGLRYRWCHNLPDSCLGKTPSEFAGAEVGSRVETILEGVLRSGEAASTEIEIVVDGRRTWWEIQACRIETGDGEPRAIASALDVTARKLNEAKLEILAKELAHRVKNIYSVNQAVIHQSARASKVSPEFVKLVLERLATLARAQDALLASPHDRVTVASIVESNLGHLDRVDASGDGATVPGRSAPFLALALHELGTNCLKYGALSDDGRVSLEWSEDANGDVHIVWQEHRLTAAEPSQHEGFGTALLTRIFSGATNGRVERDLAPEGLRWAALIPAAPELTVSG